MKIRSPTPADLAPVLDLVRECDLADYGEADDEAEEFAVLWRRMDPNRDGWIVEAEDGSIVGAAAVRVRHPTQIRSFGCVRPSQTGRGIGAELLRRIEQRAGELAAREATLSQEAAPGNEAAIALLERHGFAFGRRFWKMGVDLDLEPPEPVWPEGIRVEPMAPGGERQVFDASEEAFADHWGFVPHDYEDWRARGVELESFDPSLWLIAWDGDEIAGISICAAEASEGYVGVLAVRRPWRRKGLGLALLRHSLRELRSRGLPRASLHVDSESITGATRLYERAGMRVVKETDAYIKPL